MADESVFWTRTKRRTLYLLAGSALLSVGTTAIVAATGDMIALGYLLFAFVTLVSTLVATAAGFISAWLLEKRRNQSGAPTAAL